MKTIVCQIQDEGGYKKTRDMEDRKGTSGKTLTGVDKKDTLQTCF